MSFGADIYRHKTVLRCIIPGLASGDEVGSRSADRILDHVRQERSQNQTDGEAEDGDV